MIEMGQAVQFKPFEEITGFGTRDNTREPVTGKVIYINKPHKWFLAEYNWNGVKIRKAFQFWDIGKSVKVCGE